MGKRVKANMVTLARFDEWLDGESENFGGWESLEKSKQILDGNYQLRKEHVQLDDKSSSLACRTIVRAQYGRTRSPFVQQILDLTNVSAQDTFLDLGSGIGSVVLQASAVTGCEAIGVEICVGRHQVALQLQTAFEREFANKVSFLHGDFRTQHIFQKARNCTVLFVNNANGVFNVRSSPSDCFSLDWHVARLVAGMPNGSRVMCYDGLSDLDSAPLNQCFTKTMHVSAAGGTSWTEKSKSLTKFCIYVKTGNDWICDRCQSVNTMVQDSPTAEWGETIHDTCVECTKQGFRKPYALRTRTKRYAYGEA
ncbi:hypothetical protein BASA81_001931 [Batrachochytrium salamandrivorans]|nr:hypothetical protein BASA81_001931 [Batrachochytrium salamandrivorans]